jgi:co-chaperonin GroES (HSP10)
VIKLIGKKVAVRREKQAEKLLSGLYVPVEAQQIPKQEGVVVSVGEKCEVLKVGDRVAWSKFVGIGFEYDNQELVLMLEDEVIGVIPKENE